MSSHEELDKQWLDAVARDDERDERMRNRLTPAEFQRGAKAVSEWSDEWKADLLRMSDNERRIVLLLAGELDALPEKSEGPA